MAILNFSDILRKVNMEPREIKLIRHSVSNAAFRDCYRAGKVYEYTCHQKCEFSKGYRYWCIFIGESGTYARLYACYRVNGSVPDTADQCPVGMPAQEAKQYRGKGAFFNLTPVDLLQEYEGRLVIDWGNSTRMWHQKATQEKPVIAIESGNRQPFPGFESEQFILTFDRLKEIVENDTDYATWRAAMSAVNAVYLIVDRQTGDRYVGSTYGCNGLLGRWSAYVATGGHGKNKGLLSHLKNGKHSPRDLQFSVLQILPKSLPDSQIIDAETLWKKKLLTYQPFGLNQN